MDAVVIANPVAGTNRRRLDGARAVAMLQDAGVSASWRPTAGPGDATRLAREAAEAGAGLVVAVGGDGTVHETAVGLVGTDAALGVLPSGSGNDFAMGMGCGTVERGLAAIVGGAQRAIDVGHLDGAPFVNSVGLLASGAISGRAARLAKLWRGFGGFRYVLASVATLIDFGSQNVTWICDNGPVLEGRYLMAEICNGPTTGGGFRLAPDADPGDGHLDAVFVTPPGIVSGLRLLPAAARGERFEHPALTVRPVRDLVFRSDRPVAYHCDGEPGVLPAGEHSVGLLEATLNICVPGGSDPGGDDA